MAAAAASGSPGLVDGIQPDLEILFEWDLSEIFQNFGSFPANSLKFSDRCPKSSGSLRKYCGSLEIEGLLRLGCRVFVGFVGGAVGIV